MIQTPKRTESQKQTAERGKEARRLLQKLADQVGACERGGTWGDSGSLGHIIESLKDLTGENS